MRGNLPTTSSRAQHTFATAPQANIPRSKFDRSHGVKTTFDAGYLVPVLVDEALPGDTITLKMQAFARLGTPIFPIMDNMYLESFFFAVPYRLVWNNWQKFNGEQEDPGDSTDYLVPQMTSTAGTGYEAQSLHDYFGIPIGVPGLAHSSLWHRAYNLIWNEWFRDENLQNSVVVDKDDGPDSPTDYVLLRRGKRKDYFTSCLPWPQKGPAVGIGLSGTAPVLGIAGSPANTFTQTNATYKQSDGSSTSGSNWCYPVNSTNGNYFTIQGDNTTKVPNIHADLSDSTAVTINALREAFQVQKLYERDARGGTRYTEIVRSHFGVISPDARLQRPEYLGGGSAPIIINPIAQTSSTDGVSPQGNLAAFGVCSARGHGFSKSFTEHCLIIGLISVRADLTYQQGLNRMFSRRSRFDFYWPALSHIGEQTVLNKEIFAQGSANPTADEAVFGYQERFAEYRYKPSLITGQFNSNYSAPLDAWHLAQDFAALPTLNSTFIEENPPLDRVIALADTYPHFLFDSYFKYHCARPMPVFAVPGLVDHF